MNASSASGKENASSLERLDAALRSIQTEAAPAELAAQIAGLVAGADGIKGARIWRYVSEQRGGGSRARPIAGCGCGAARARFATNLRAKLWMAAMRRGCSGRKENAAARWKYSARRRWRKRSLDWLRLVRRYADMALVSSERRSAVSELSIVLEATQRLNSTLDLAELIDIILHLATRYTGADRGTVFLVGSRAR